MADFNGDNGANVLNGSSDGDTMPALAGSDTGNGADGADTMSGGEGSDTLNGGAGNDIIYGFGASDATAGSGDINASLVTSALTKPIFALSAPGFRRDDRMNYEMTIASPPALVFRPAGKMFESCGWP